MMECYWAYADYQDMMRLTENMISFIAQEALGTMTVVYDGKEVNLAPSWRRVSLPEAIQEQTGIDIFESYPDVKALWAECQRKKLNVTPQPTWGKLVEELLGEYVEPTLVQPTFIHTFPVEISPLSKQNPDDPRMVERFEAYIACMEVGNAYSELNDPTVQRQRFLEQQQGGDEEAHTVDDDYVMALMQGMPPTGGLGIGIDRLTMLLTDQQSIREVILFPHLRARE
jgi:lysyl-tRNA synthetase class 2